MGIALLFSSKAIIQFLFNPVAGWVIRTIGPSYGMLFAAVVFSSIHREGAAEEMGETTRKREGERGGE